MTKALRIIIMNELVGTTKREIFEGQFKFYYMEFYNSHAANTLYVTFDGTHYRTITTGGRFALRGFADKPIILKNKVKVWANAPSTTFEITYLKEAE